MTANEAHTLADKTQRNEWKVLLVLALSLLLMETLVRCFAGSLSVDLRNILATRQTASRIGNAPDDVRTVLVVGNSLARCGVDLTLLGEGTNWPPDDKSRGVAVHLFAPDGSSVVQWNWGMKRYFANAGAHPDVILLFTGRTHLLDLPASPETLGAYYVGTSDLGGAMKSMKGSENSMRMLLGATSHLLSNRERIRTRVGYSYLPGFEIAWPTLTTMNDAEAEASGWQPETASTDSLGRFISTAREMGSDLYVISVPMPDPYQLPEPVLGLLEDTQVPHLNLSILPGIGADRFPDGYHLDESGARIFTKAMLSTLDP